MGIVDNALIGASGQGGYFLSRSLRFRSSASAYLNRTFASGNRQTWTWSAWVKRGSLGVQQALFSDNEVSNYSQITFQSDDKIRFGLGSGATNPVIDTVAVFRDPSAWYHIVAVADTTNATGNDRLRLYVNGVRQSISAIVDFPMAQNYNGGINRAVVHSIARNSSYGTYFDGYMTEVNFIDGQALTPSSFGSTNTLTGVWQPARYVGTYGTTGFYLPFTDNSALTTSSNVGLGKDFSGNGNYWATNNISITAGATYDSMTDVPTLTSATAANFCVLNPINKSSSSTVSNGNLRQTSSGGWYRAYSTIFFDYTASFYCETTMTALNSGSNGVRIGVANANTVMTYVGSDANSWAYDNQGRKLNNAATTSYGSSFVQGDVIGILFSNGSLTFYKNGVSQGVAYSGLTGTFCFTGSPFDTDIVDWNFGQRPFVYSLPSGALALNTFNLPTSTIVKGNTVMDATLFTGNTSGATVTNAGGFKPDFVWNKARDVSQNHFLIDSVRGGNKLLYSNLTDAEATNAQLITSFNSNGFTYGNALVSANNYVAWQWQAGQGSTSSNTNGTITSTVSVNASAGFSIVTYTGTAAAATVGHGLGVAPQLIIGRSRTNSGFNWGVWHISLQTLYGNNAWIRLNTTDAYTTSFDVFDPQNNTSSVFGIGSEATMNASGSAIVAYCWTPIAGFSAFGSYTGNGSSDGPMVYTGFRPKYVLVKCSSSDLSGSAHWVVQDSSRSTYNAADAILYPNLSNNEGSGEPVDLLSNGFKIRNTVARWNSSGATFIYMAFAENPFKNALAR